MAEKHPERIEGGIQRASGEITPFNAGDAVAATVDICRQLHIPLAPSIRARLGKGAKALLESEFPPDIVVAACVTAIRTNWFGSVESIAQEMAVAAAGGRQTRSEYQAALAATSEQIKRSNSRIWQTMRSEMERRERAESRGLPQ